MGSISEIKTSLETIKKIYQMLEDKESKETYANLISYFFTEDPKYIQKVTSSYLEKSLNGYSGNYASFPQLPKDAEERDVVLFGAGKEGQKLMSFFKNDSRFIGFCSSLKTQQHTGCFGFPVISPQELFARRDLNVVISTSKAKAEIMQILKDGEYPQELIFDGPSVYAPDSGEAEQYFGPSFLTFKDEEVFVDAGCFDFQTSLALTNHCVRAKVYAFEPDPKCYQECKMNIDRRDKTRLPDVKLFQCGTWSERTTLHFCATGQSHSHVSEGAADDVTISTMPIDEAIDPGDQVTMIKMDIEGSELEALKGAKTTIQRDKPKLAICIYHKPEDLWEIPLYIKELVPEYRFYIRHHSFFGATETVLYAVMP